ncbi:MAG: HAD hydrolase-like protein [Coprococcus sp.]
MYEYYLFDLDGTLTKSELGIYNCIKYALDWAHIPYPDESVFRKCIGPSLYYSFTTWFGLDDEKAKAMVAKYRERYNTVGLFENEVYDGIYDLLAELKERGAKLAVATSKPTEPTLRILEKFDLMKYFDVAIGSNPDGTGSDKKMIIAEVLKKLADENTIMPHTAAMVGDRFYDIEGGRANNIDTIGVLYGYGNKEELKKAGATHIVATPAEISAIF